MEKPKLQIPADLERQRDGKEAKKDWLTPELIQLGNIYHVTEAGGEIGPMDGSASYDIS